MPLCSRGQQALVSVTELSPPPPPHVPLEWAGPPGQEVGLERSPGPLLIRDEPNEHKFVHSQVYTNMDKYTLEHTPPLYFYYCYLYEDLHGHTVLASLLP